MTNYVVLGASTLLGYKFGEFIGGNSAGEKGRLHWEWWLRVTKLHIHHWIIMLILLILYIMFADSPSLVIIGFLLGGVIHGLTYNDWYKIIAW